ncbi:MAG: ABC transporter ATP-binding protein [Acidimicrobiia bacterium]|nr:ABC transporter ATP-binding protein [Acidimicrobiia bacterium]
MTDPTPVTDGTPTQPPASPYLLEVKNLQVSFYTRRGTVRAVRGVHLKMNAGETLGIVGESGSGKSVTARAILGLVDLPGAITGGDILWKGQSLLHGKGAKSRARKVRGKEMSMVFQNPMTSFNPLYTIGDQIREVLKYHLDMGKKEGTERAVELLNLVGMSNPKRRVDQYPHEFSGGMRQRAMIAMALASEPKLLIADEPTTALDVTIQAQILELLDDLQSRLGLTTILITHDLAVVAGVCHRVRVMYAGKFVEKGNAAEIFGEPGHPYTVGLLKSTPRLDELVPRLYSIAGSPPDLRLPVVGCPFRPRCELAMDSCAETEPLLTGKAGTREVACLRSYEAEAVIEAELEAEWEATEAHNA